MTNYLLTVIGVADSEKYCDEIALAITPVVDSPHLKFQNNLGTMLYHFASDVNECELFDYITGVLYGISDSFILTEVSDKMMVSLPEKIRKGLFDLTTSVGCEDMGYDMDRIKNNSDFSEQSEDDEENFMMLLNNDFNRINKPSLNQILDKILNKGVNSLTPFEQEILENYSKN